MDELEVVAPEGDDSGEPQAPRVTILLPYSISNMVFFQGAVLWLGLLAGACVMLVGFAGLARGAQTHPAVIAGAVFTLLAGVVLVVMRYALWRPASRGRTAAISIVYAFHAILVFGSPLLLPMAAFVLSPLILSQGGEPDGSRIMALAMTGLVVLVVFGLVWLLALVNLFERGFWRFASFDGRCPACRQWRFGRIAGPTTVRCEQCGASLEFCRRDQQGGGD